MPLKQKHLIVIADDEVIILKSLQRLFNKEGHEVLTAENGRTALALLAEHADRVSMIISDQRMPEMSGVEFLEKAKQVCPDSIRYLLTGNTDLDTIVDAVNKGEIHRYFEKPWDDAELAAQVRISLENRELQSEVRRLTEITIRQNRQLNTHNKELEQKVEARTREIAERNRVLAEANQLLEQSFMDAVHLLSSLVEMLNPSLGSRMRKVALLARSVGEAMGIEKDELNNIEMAGMIHDIGLLALPEELWTMDPQRMSDKQLRMYSQHPVMGSVILDRVQRLGDVGELVLFHHEHVDGNGFPNGLKGTQIPLGSKIILAVSDYYETFETWPSNIRKLIAKTRQHFEPSVFQNFTLEGEPETIIAEVAAELLKQGVGTKYDATVVAELVKRIYKIKKIEPKVSVSVDHIKAGMLLMEDMRLRDGRLLLTKGTMFKEATIKSIQSLIDRGMITGEVTVSAPSEKEDAPNA